MDSLGLLLSQRNLYYLSSNLKLIRVIFEKFQNETIYLKNKNTDETIKINHRNLRLIFGSSIIFDKTRIYFPLSSCKSHTILSGIIEFIKNMSKIKIQFKRRDINAHANIF